jgi:Zn-dependent peptidase ImmA (M78 family)
LHRDLLHERGHLDRLFDAGGYANPSSPLTPQHEVEANKLAAAILMPREAIREMLVWANFDLHELADRFGVSAASMEIRLRVLGIDLEYEKSQMSRGRDVDIPF